MDQATRQSIWEVVAEGLRSVRRLPVSTYRLQFNQTFDFRAARDLVPYLHDLGVTDCYSSPCLQARPGSQHGYDICDHRSMNTSLGSEQDFDSFVSELKKYGMGQILDVVPNHMSTWETSNAKWADVLENGIASPYSVFFDIDWHPLRSDTHLEERVLLPILAEAYGTVLENQELVLSYEEGAFFVSYYEHKLPLDPRSYLDILERCEAEMAERLEADDEQLHELQSIHTALTHLPPRNETGSDQVLERQREKEVVKRRLRQLWELSLPFRQTLEGVVQQLNGTRGEASSFDRLDALLEQQPYRLAHWQVAAEEINYRRFFDVNDLVALRQEDPWVFEETHQLVFDLLREGKITGLRIDHPDGLWDPASYFARLQRNYLLELARGQLASGREASADRWAILKEMLSSRLEWERAEPSNSLLLKPLYIVAEKILSQGETLPRHWATYGTTGYEFANAVNGIFVDTASARAFDVIYKRFTGVESEFEQLVDGCKKMVMSGPLASETNMLGYQLKRVAVRNRRYRDFTLNSLTFALREVIACLPVYRTYIVESEASADPRDREYIEGAIRKARRRNPSMSPAVFNFLADILLLRWPENLGDEERGLLLDFLRKFQQTTGPVMAKAVEDTVLYQYNRLLSLNEVGGSPAQFGTPLDDFHHQNAERQKLWPYSLLCTSTHDTKRSEDVRARIDVLSELPREWRSALLRWSRLNRRKKKVVLGQSVPDPNEEYYLYQTLLGVWPLEPLDDTGYRTFIERIETHMLKAIKEAKVNTSWINPNVAYEEAVQSFVRAILDRTHANPFLKDFRDLQEKVSHYGTFNSLSQTLVKIASPGVPDFYQGSELWDFSLVDPDNRRPVDFSLRAHLLQRLKGEVSGSAGGVGDLSRELLRDKQDGRIKLMVIHGGLVYRREHPELFSQGAYIPLRGLGSRAEHICAFARRKSSRTALVVVPRLPVRLTRGELNAPVGEKIWEDTFVTLPTSEAGRAFRNLFTDEVVRAEPLARGGFGLPVAAVLATFPVALLDRV